MEEEKIYSLMDAYNGIQDATTFVGFGPRGVIAGIEFFLEDEIKIVVPDVRPEGGGEYWESRGASVSDVSGFIKSKEAGQRLLRFVKYVLEKDEIETWLDYREREPEWIQFKFSAEEFDVNKLDELSRANNGILTEDIIKQCVLKTE